MIGYRFRFLDSLTTSPLAPLLQGEGEFFASFGSSR
jgi:hypothetical protein